MLDSVTFPGIKVAAWIVVLAAWVPSQVDSPDGPYDVRWRTPSRDASGSMPLGNGDIGLNAWVEPNGDLLCYVSKTDAWGDNARLLKVGKIRIRLDPAPETSDGSFQQVLRLQDATMVVRCGKGDGAVELKVWVDANRPVVHITVAGSVPRRARAVIELWRTERRELPSLEVSDILLDRSKPDQKRGATIVEPDTVLTKTVDRIGWFHHNSKSIGPALCAEIQGLAGFRQEDPLLGRTFGAVITALGGRRVDALNLATPESKTHRFSVHVLTKHPATPRQWRTAIDDVVAGTRGEAFPDRRRAHVRWWKAFWNRSWIHAAARGPKRELVKDDAQVVSRAYALQRYINACAGRGAFPIKFNGSIFTVPWPGKPGDADYRRWGPGYWWQNTRLPYVGMCASGDFDLMQPLFRMYVDVVLPLSVHRTRTYCGHSGAFIPECIYFWGAMFSETYGWTPFKERGQDKLQSSRWHKWEWVSGLELVHLMLDYHDHTQDAAFLANEVLPTAHEILTFFDEHYEVGADGKLVMHPSQAAETWWECTNPMPEVAGLHAVTARLLALGNDLSDDRQRAFWVALKKKLPELPTREIDGARALAPAQKYAMKRNSENPELYAVYPFRLVGVGRPGLALGLRALKHRWDRGNSGWRQDDLFMACLGLADGARDNLVARARNKHAQSRFPAFWGPNYDWIPDQDHGGILVKTLQAMVLQADPGLRGKIHVLPAWPRDWDVRFKLHAPQGTTVDCEYRAGRLMRLHVVPTERRRDVILPTGMKPPSRGR